MVRRVGRALAWVLAVILPAGACALAYAAFQALAPFAG